jgi:hypothetical protein
MDLTLLIVLVVAGFLLFYLIETIRSLHKEIKEMKLKCIKTVYNDDPSIFKENTIELSTTIQENLLNMLYNAKNIFDKNT